MRNVLLVGLGSALGGMGRYLISLFLALKVQTGWFPWNTFSVNAIGSLIVGLVFGLLLHKPSANNELLKLLLMVGFLGGFTTFSAFSLDNALLILQHFYLTALLNVFANVVISLSLTFLGLALARVLF